MRVLARLTLLALLVAACDTSTGQVTTTITTAAPSTSERAATSSTRAMVGLPDDVAAVTADWNTDFTQSTVDLDELKVGIPVPDPRDRIPPIDDPEFQTVRAADDWLADAEPGVLLRAGQVARFYPLAILTRHEIVNDRIGGQPVVVTYCPLCNTALAFDPTVEGEVMRFGVSGLLRQSDLVMWDRTTESLWQQITGESIVGTLAGTRLEPIPTAIVSWADFARTHPDGEVLSEDQGFGIEYGVNPYTGYSSRQAPIPSFFEGEIDERYPALSRVVGVTIADETVAYPFSLIEERGAINDRVGDRPVTVLWGAPDTADALDTSSIASGQAIGTAVAYIAESDGTELTLEPLEGDLFRDIETGTTWTLLGDAVEGPLAGSRLELAPHRNEFWFAFAAFFPEARVWEPE